jgi:hypothetical protein
MLILLFFLDTSHFIAVNGYDIASSSTLGILCGDSDPWLSLSRPSSISCKLLMPFVDLGRSLLLLDGDQFERVLALGYDRHSSRGYKVCGIIESQRLRQRWLQDHERIRRVLLADRVGLVRSLQQSLCSRSGRCEMQSIGREKVRRARTIHNMDSVDGQAGVRKGLGDTYVGGLSDSRRASNSLGSSNSLKACCLCAAVNGIPSSCVAMGGGRNGRGRREREMGQVYLPRCTRLRGAGRRMDGAKI